MNLRLLSVLGLMLLLAGCSSARRRHDAYQELLDAEKRALEDQLYDLDYEYNQLHEKYASVQRENDTLRKSLKKPGATTDDAADEDEPFSPRSPVAPTPLDDSDLTPPEIDLGTPMSPGESAPIAPPAAVEPEELLEPSTNFRPETDDSDAAPLPEDLVDPHVTHIHLNPLLTGGSDFDDKPGDEGVSIVIEPRNAADDYVAVAGPISIVVLDPARQGEAARVARWDFTAHEARETMTRTAFGKGIHLRLPWPSRTPDNPKLNLFVRYTAPDGKKLEAEREIFVEPAGRVSSRWTPLTEEEIGDSGKPNAESGEPDAANVAESRETVAAPLVQLPPRAPIEPKSPPPGPTPSDKTARPQWSPYR